MELHNLDVSELCLPACLCVRLIHLSDLVQQNAEWNGMGVVFDSSVHANALASNIGIGE